MSSHDPLLETLRTQLGQVLKPDIERLFDEAYQEAFTDGKAMLKERILAAILDGSSSLLEGLGQLAPSAPPASAAPLPTPVAVAPAVGGTPPLPEPPPMPSADMEAYPTTLLKVEAQALPASDPRPATPPADTLPTVAHPLASPPPTHP